MLSRRADRRQVGTEESRRVVGGALRRYLALSLVAFFVAASVTVVASHILAKDEAVREAEVRSVGMANGIVSPFVDRALRGGRPGADAALSRVVHNRLREGSIKHVKLWSVDGSVFWSDEAELIGKTFEMPAQVEALFGTRGSVVEFSELDREENDLDRFDGPLLEVYVGAFDEQGQPYVFEAYWSEERIARDRSAIISRLLPMTLGLLLLVQLIALPLGFSLVRHVHRALTDRSRALTHSLESWHEQRRQLAADLHDEVIPDLAGVAYALPSVAAELPADGAARGAAERMSTLIQQDIAALRTLVTDLFPNDLQGPGLRTALEDLVTRAEEAGVETRLRLTPGLELSSVPAGLVFRVVREGLRNAVRHAHARHVEVHVARADSGRAVVVTVVDDGVGPVSDVEPGHVGLRLLTRVLEDVGGQLDLRPGEGGGAELLAHIPVER